MLSIALATTHAAAQDRSDQLFESIEWLDGPAEGPLGDIAKLTVPDGCRFTREDGARAFMEATGNLLSDTELGVLVCRAAPPDNPADESNWFVVFEYDASGYVKDDEKAELDGDKILATLQEGQDEGNKERRRLGYDELTLDGWIRPPYYDDRTNNLTWAIRVLATGDTSVNHSVRLLGRGGVLKADLVTGPSTFDLALPKFEQVVDATSFVPGQTYSEWREGDKIAAYGLTALVAGGAGAAAVKLGLFGKLWKLILAGAKFIIVGVVAFFAWIRSFFKKKSEEVAPAPTSAG
jgi:uncharacterized membrane-anchored protein